MHCKSLARQTCEYINTKTICIHLAGTGYNDFSHTEILRNITTEAETFMECHNSILTFNINIITQIILSKQQ